MITVTHSIFDGISAFASLASLFLILQGLATNTLDERDIVDAPVVEPIEKLLEKYIKENNLSHDQLGEFHQVRAFERPKELLVTPNQNREEYRPHTIDCKTGAFYSAIDKRPVIRLNELADLSERSVTKFNLIKFKDDNFRHFVAKCKENKAKVSDIKS